MSRRSRSKFHVSILVETEDTWGRKVAEAVCRFGQTAGWTILISPRDREGKLRLPRIWNGHGVVAALRNASMKRHLKKKQVPVVDVSSVLKKESWFARVATDDRVRAQLAVDHFTSRGIRHFACYAPSIGRYSDARSHEFRACVEAVGSKCATYSSDDRNTSGSLTNYANAREWLMRLPKPVGIFAGDPYPARQLVEVCTMDAIQVPDDVAILSGDDDDLLCNVASPQISSVELASYVIGKTAAQTLQRLMKGATIPQRVKTVSPLRIRSRQSTDTLAIDDPDLARALKFIRDHAMDGITVSDVVRASSVSRRSLEQRFRDKLHRSPGEEIRRARLEHVRRLLVDTDKSIAMIASESGFASGISLSQAYQKYFGEPPGQFRKSWRQ